MGSTTTTVQKEFMATRAIHAGGLPAPATYELIDLEGRQGIVFERIDGISMLSQVQAKPWTLFRASRQLAELHAKVHSAVGPEELASQRERIGNAIDNTPECSEADRQSAHRCLAALPDGAALCHGDFHPENILYSSRGPIIIDWGAATRGDPLGDVACTSRLMQHARLPSWVPWPMHWLLKCSRALLHRSYLKRYLQLRPGSIEQINAWQKPLRWPLTRGASQNHVCNWFDK